MRMEHHRLEVLEQTLYHTGENISQAMLTAALLIGSAMILVAKVPPLWHRVSLIGALGFMAALFSGAMIMLRSRRKRRKMLRERARRQAFRAENRRRER